MSAHHRPLSRPALLLAALLASAAAAGPSPASPAPAAPAGADTGPTTLIIDKSQHILRLYTGQRRIVSYPIALGRGPAGPKTCAGPDRTPEGEYRIDSRNAHSAYHLALHLSYPNTADQQRARAVGCQPGGDIMIHGLRNGLGWLGRLHQRIDWTAGCIALTNARMDTLWRLAPTGTRVIIRP